MVMERALLGICHWRRNDDEWNMIFNSGFLEIKLVGLRRIQYPHIDRLVQERRNSSSLAMELRLSCTNPSIYEYKFKYRIMDMNINNEHTMTGSC